VTSETPVISNCVFETVFGSLDKYSAMVLTYEFAHDRSESMLKTPHRHINNIKNLISTTLFLSFFHKLVAFKLMADHVNFYFNAVSAA